MVKIDYKYIDENEYGYIVLETNGGGTPCDSLVLNIDEDGDVYLTIETEYTGNDGVPVSVWEGRTMQFTVLSACNGGGKAFTLDSIISYLEDDKILSIVEKIAMFRSGNGKDVEDSDEIENLMMKLEHEFYDADVRVDFIPAVDALEWLLGTQNDWDDVAELVGIDKNTPGNELKKIADELFEMALDEGFYIIGETDALEDALAEVQDNLTQEDDEEDW